MTGEAIVPDRRGGDLKLDELSARVDDLATHHKTIVAEVQRNTEITQRIDLNTAGMVAAWGALEGGMKVLNVLGKVAKWVGIIAGAIAAVYSAWWAAHGNGPTP